MRASASSRPASPSASPAVQVRPLIHLILSPTPLSTKMMMQWTSLSIHLLVFSEEHLHRAARHQLIRAIRGLNPNNHRILFYFSLFFLVRVDGNQNKRTFRHTHLYCFSPRSSSAGQSKGLDRSSMAFRKKREEIYCLLDRERNFL